MDVAWTVPALADLETIQDFVAEESPSAAFALTERIMGRTAQLLGSNLLAGRPGRRRGTREFVVSGTAYIVAYRVTDRVEVLAVVHGARAWPEFGNS